MVDTYLRPRPEFGTFLLSDTTADGDGLSFYKYKASLRKNRVSILQKKRETDVSEKVKVLEDYRKSLAHPNIDKAVGGHGNRTRHWTEPGYVPRPAERTVKSAGLRRNLSLDEATVSELQRNARPKTAEHVPRNVSGQTESSLPKIGSLEESFVISCRDTPTYSIMTRPPVQTGVCTYISVHTSYTPIDIYSETYLFSPFIVPGWVEDSAPKHSQQHPNVRVQSRMQNHVCVREQPYCIWLHSLSL